MIFLITGQSDTRNRDPGYFLYPKDSQLDYPDQQGENREVSHLILKLVKGILLKKKRVVRVKLTSLSSLLS